jgi:hypothetical protein
MTVSISQFSKARLGGAPCPADLALLLTRCGDVLDDAGIEMSLDPAWAPWADKSYLTEADLKDPDIRANVKAIDDTCACITFVARADEGECIGYWRGPERRPIESSPVVIYDTEGQFRLCGGSFVEGLFFVLYDEDALASIRSTFAEAGAPLLFESIDEIKIPSVPCTAEDFHRARYQAHQKA